MDYLLSQFSVAPIQTSQPARREGECDDEYLMNLRAIYTDHHAVMIPVDLTPPIILYLSGLQDCNSFTAQSSPLCK